jgi:fluoride exporter
MNSFSPVLDILMIALGAIPGALTRFHLTEWCKKTIGRGFPYGTFLINITGCLVTGIFVAVTTQVSGFSVPLKLLVATGFLGSYTTFSTYEFDTFTLGQQGKWGAMVVYGVGSVVLGVLAIYWGDRLGKSFTL